MPLVLVATLGPTRYELVPSTNSDLALDRCAHTIYVYNQPNNLSPYIYIYIYIYTVNLYTPYIYVYDTSIII